MSFIRRPTLNALCDVRDPWLTQSCLIFYQNLLKEQNIFWGDKQVLYGSFASYAMTLAQKPRDRGHHSSRDAFHLWSAIVCRLCQPCLHIYSSGFQIKHCLEWIHCLYANNKWIFFIKNISLINEFDCYLIHILTKQLEPNIQMIQI